MLAVNALHLTLPFGGARSCRSSPIERIYGISNYQIGPSSSGISLPRSSVYGLGTPMFISVSASRRKFETILLNQSLSRPDTGKAPTLEFEPPLSIQDASVPGPVLNALEKAILGPHFLKKLGCDI